MVLMLIKYWSLKNVSYRKNNSFKYFIGYNDNDIIRPLFVKLPEMTSYINKFKDRKKKLQQQECPLWLKINNFSKVLIKYGQKLKV